MSDASIETDYLVIGAGAIGMAFVDSLLTSSPDASVVMVDRRHRPGGHWNDSYPFVRLHQPAGYYGVNSRELGDDTLDSAGLNQGFYGLSSGPEIVGYFDQVMQQRFLSSGRVRFMPMSQVVESQEVESLLTGRRQRVRVRNKVVDATFSDMRIPATTPPKYAVADGVRCVPVNDLVKLDRAQTGYVVVGSGKTGIDACLWLLEQGVDPDRIRWVMPRDAWIQDRANVQHGERFLANTCNGLSMQLEAAAAATDVPDLFRRLEACGHLMRIDPQVEPTVYHGAIVSQAEMGQLRRIRGIVRMGHVRSIGASHVELDQGSVPLAADELIVDCSAVGIPSRPAVPIWSGQRLTPQWVRSFGTTFSAALIAHIEATFDADEAAKNALCAPIVPPTAATDWLRMLAVSRDNAQRWTRDPALREWLATSRLNSLFHAMMKVSPDDAENMALLQRYQQSVKPGVAGLQRLMLTLA
ncbi:MAG: NAD(P)/FAD-dependent oxidoreductase [Pseudomonadota bacterium]|nr:NAD(P)/FAD-dependent oxidoreductase [Pseudomonadota bacterium]